MNFDVNESVFDYKTIDRLGIRWGGVAGDGLQSVGLSLAKYLIKVGYFSFGFPGTQSTIRGGHIYINHMKR